MTNETRKILEDIFSGKTPIDSNGKKYYVKAKDFSNDIEFIPENEFVNQKSNLNQTQMDLGANSGFEIVSYGGGQLTQNMNNNSMKNNELNKNLKYSNMPYLRDDKRRDLGTIVESYIHNIPEYLTNNNHIGQILGAAQDLGKSYIDMINTNRVSSQNDQLTGRTADNYYHCIGHYNAGNRGVGGQLTSDAIGYGKELLDYIPNRLRKGKDIARTDFDNDISVNKFGQHQSMIGLSSSAEEACKRYKPFDIGDEKYNIKKYYYK